MTATRITAEEIAAYRTEYSTAIYAGHTVSHVNRILDALESAYAELDRLRAAPVAVAVPETQWTVAQMLANAWERFPLKCGERDALVAEWNALRSKGGE